MPIERVFLGWDGPCLPRAARWLAETFGSSDGPPDGSLADVFPEVDLSRVILVTPGRRSGRRLLELLVEAADDRLLSPPQHATPGDLFDLLCPPELSPTPSARPADELRCLLARVASLRAADDATLRLIVPVPPPAGDLRPWLSLANDLHRLHDALAAEAVTHRDVLKRCGGAFEFDDSERWEALAALQADYQSALARQGLVDPQAARIDLLRALEAGSASVASRLDAGATIVLVATADIPGILRRLLAAIGSQGHAPIHALIHAPADEAAAFDSVGCLIPDAWADRRVDLDAGQVSVVDRPRDQAHEALRLVSLLAAPGSPPAHDAPPAPAPDQITLGLGDEALAPLVERTFELAGLPARAAAGRPVSLSRPALFLDAWARFLDRRRFDDFAALLRHPDVESFLLHALGPGVRDSVTGWLTLLDKYLTEYVQRRVSRHLIGPPHITGPLKAVVEAIDTLLPPELAGAPMQAKKRRLSEWSAPIADALTKLYARRPLDRHHPDDAPLVYALRALGQALREQAQLDNVGANAATTAAANADPSNLALSLSDAIALTLSRVRDLAPPPPEPASAAVEILGWLELQLDDAPHLIVTGVNEGMIPESVNHDAFLPDSLRRDLGLLDNRRRHARDLMALTAILHSRPHVRLVAGRRSADDDPLTPSRLLLACAGDELARRIGRFYDHSEEPAPPPPLLPTGKRSRLVIPPPVAPLAAIEELNVTAFRDYLACPYRFYLKHVCKLDTLDDRAVELSAPAFGNLAHKVLENFGQGPLATSDNPADIADFLNEELDRACRLTYGQQPTVAITLQREQLRQRLAAFARWQAQETRDGWSIAIQTEKRFAAPFPVDGQPFRIVGRIDRIDRHPEKGLRILDYKTGDKGEFPEKTHRFKGEWVDLQLPLYRLLARAAGLEGACALGYVLLPKKLAETGLAAAEWSEEELAHAEEEARRIVRAIRQSIFWPPTEPPKFDDGLGSICMDLSLDRARVIRAGGSGGEGSAGT